MKLYLIWCQCCKSNLLGYPAILTSCSVDNKMATLTTGGKKYILLYLRMRISSNYGLGVSYLFAGFVTLLLLIAIAVLGFLTVALLNHFGVITLSR